MIGESIKSLDIRKATLLDIGRIAEIYNETIIKTTATFDTEPKTIDQMKEWFLGHGKKNPIVVAELDKKIVGWASLSTYSTRCAYSNTVELSIYVDEKYHGQGIGNKLLEEILLCGKDVGLHVVLARIADGNDISIKLLEKHGFFHVGILKEVGFKFGNIIDVHIMEKIYEEV